MYLKHQQKLKLRNEQNKTFKTEEDIQKVIDLYKSGLSCNQIAKEFNCSKFPVLRVIKDLPKRNPGNYPQHRSKHQFGEKNTSWQGGIKSIYDRIRDLNVYWLWRNTIIKRDNNQCTNCKIDSSLEVHHKITLKSLIQKYCKDNNKLIKDLIEEDLNNNFFYDLDNGITFCKQCHRNHHKIYGR
jgi:5-methylcytosine-specific restriction endonuclease McrA